MGFLRKITGAQGQINAMNKNTSAQIKAARETADAQVAALNDSARAAADNQRNMAERAKVEDAASESLNQPMGVADVALDAPQAGSSIAGVRKRRQQFGTGYSSSGVNI